MLTKKLDERTTLVTMLLCTPSIFNANPTTLNPMFTKYIEQAKLIAAFNKSYFYTNCIKQMSSGYVEHVYFRRKQIY